ncbi:MAG: sporulation protein, partial [Oscillospiraceae bacterium]|nr:sporulation protein [Oscillospiraceae bacterium]
MRRKIYELLGTAALICCASALVCFPAEAVEAASSGLKLCLDVIVPSLFPFFVISTLTVEMGLAEKMGRLIEPLMRKLFNVSGACASAFVLGFVGGYPVGAKTAIALYERGECSRREAERLLSFCNNSGPAFILGVVGAGVFSDNRVG